MVRHVFLAATLIATLSCAAENPGRGQDADLIPDPGHSQPDDRGQYQASGCSGGPAPADNPSSGGMMPPPAAGCAPPAAPDAGVTPSDGPRAWPWVFRWWPRENCGRHGAGARVQITIDVLASGTLDPPLVLDQACAALELRVELPSENVIHGTYRLTDEVGKALPGPARNFIQDVHDSRSVFMTIWPPE